MAEQGEDSRPGPQEHCAHVQAPCHQEDTDKLCGAQGRAIELSCQVEGLHCRERLSECARRRPGVGQHIPLAGGCEYGVTGRCGMVRELGSCGAFSRGVFQISDWAACYKMSQAGGSGPAPSLKACSRGANGALLSVTDTEFTQPCTSVWHWTVELQCLPLS